VQIWHYVFPNDNPSYLILNFNTTAFTFSFFFFNRSATVILKVMVMPSESRTGIAGMLLHVPVTKT